MSNEVKKSKNAQKNSMIEIVCMNTAVEKGGKILDEMLSKGSILEFDLHQAEMSIKLGDHQVSKKTGKRYIDGIEVGKGKTAVKSQEDGRE